jgi:8-oxo-dGTP pyrophosphatase MutT (NUDIX family)
MPMDLLAGTLPVRIDGTDVGCVTEDWLARLLDAPTPFALRDDALGLAHDPGGFDARSAMLARWAADARARWSLPGWRDETVVVRGESDGRPLFGIERALLRALGLLLPSVQASAWSMHPDGPRIWVARRAFDKPIDPGRLDALVAGGIAGFDDPHATLLRECAQEAGIPESLARRAQPLGSIELAYPCTYDGLAAVHRERVSTWELELPADFVPVPVDGEHESIEAMHPADALASIERGGWTADGAQATLDLILRLGALPAGGAQASMRA